jgi:acyl-CoA synthetase (AMP-forming)/AMP-acid ligase II
MRTLVLCCSMRTMSASSTRCARRADVRSRSWRWAAATVRRRQIALRGPTAMAGYWRRPEETAAARRDGWLHSGDAGRLVQGGYLYVVDRIKDMIVTGGDNVYSAEFENVVAMHPSVAMCAVIGGPDPLWGETVGAVVVRRAGTLLDEDGLKVHGPISLANHKCPKRVEFVDALPLTAAGKVAKNRLRDARLDAE